MASRPLRRIGDLSKRTGVSTERLRAWLRQRHLADALDRFAEATLARDDATIDRHPTGDVTA